MTERYGDRKDGVKIQWRFIEIEWRFDRDAAGD